MQIFPRSLNYLPLIGALVAVVGAHKELYSPWKELLSHYQLTWDSQIKFEQVVAQFDPAGIREESLQTADPAAPVPMAGQLRAANLTLVSEDGQVILDGASFTVELPARVALLGPAAETGCQMHLADQAAVVALVRQRSGEERFVGRQ